MLTGFQKVLTTFRNSPGIPSRMRSKAPDNPDREMPRQLAFLGLLTDEQRLCLPDWLIIAPPKTGTSWAYANLHEHPQVFVPQTKELNTSATDSKPKTCGVIWPTFAVESAS